MQDLTREHNSVSSGSEHSASTSGNGSDATQPLSSIFLLGTPCRAFAPFLLLAQENEDSSSPASTVESRETYDEESHERALATWVEINDVKRLMPDAQLLHTLHFYAVEYFSQRQHLKEEEEASTKSGNCKKERREGCSDSAHRAFDGSALVAIGVIIEELVKWEAGVLHIAPDAPKIDFTKMTPTIAKAMLTDLKESEARRRKTMQQKIRRDEKRRAASVDTTRSDLSNT